MDVLVLADHQKLTFIGFVCTPDSSDKTSQEQWMIRMDGERESGNSVVSLWQKDDSNI